MRATFYYKSYIERQKCFYIIIIRNLTIVTSLNIAIYDLGSVVTSLIVIEVISL